MRKGSIGDAASLSREWSVYNASNRLAHLQKEEESRVTSRKSGKGAAIADG